MLSIFVAAASDSDLLYFWLLLLVVFLGLVAFFLYDFWMDKAFTSPSPYTKMPLRSGEEIHWLTREKVLRYLFDMHDYHNGMFDVTLAAFCRETGRLFPDALTWYGAIKVDWNFLQKRFPGKFVSWGSLTEDQKTRIIDQHLSLEGFQTEISSSEPSPRKVQPEYAFTKPGPLYVDIETGVLVGWKCVPETDLEVLIVQKPKETYIPGLHKKY